MPQATVPIHAQPMAQPMAPQLPGIPGGQVPISIVGSPPLAPPAGAPGAPVNTHVSAQRPAGTPTYTGGAPLPVQVVEPPPYQKGAPWWVVIVVAFVGIWLGFAAGMLVAG
jgi:hypothetical protein